MSKRLQYELSARERSHVRLQDVQGYAHEDAPGRKAYNDQDIIPDKVSVLAEPFAVGLHAVCRNMPKDDDTVIVIGAGTIGLMLVAAIRALGSKCRVIAIARYRFQAEAARKLGTDRVIIEKSGY